MIRRMKIWSIILLLFAFCFLASFGRDFKDTLPKSLRFEHSRCVFSIKETHNIGLTHHRLKTLGCGTNGISFHAQLEGTPFRIDPSTGRLVLKKRLDFMKQKQYNFMVRAVADNDKCKKEKAITWVVVNVRQHNQYRPQFTADKYYCRILEETSHIKVFPLINVTDRDPGPAGKISQVQVRESNEPFVLELDETTGAVTVMPTPGYKFDSTRMSSYKFSLQAWDGGDPPRNSRPIKMNCIVVPQNRHSPVFTKNTYIGHVKQGKISSNIVQVNAKDADTDKDFGKICEYFIRTSDMPFNINKKGVVSLSKPLGPSSPDTFVFTVMAKDCGGRMSEEATTVNVIVDKECSPGFVEPHNKSLSLNGCEGMVRVTPDIRLNVCGETLKHANFSAKVTMETEHILKGCDRETYEASGVFKLCNVSQTVDLLPSSYREGTWMDGIMTEESIIGESVYHFNKIAVNIPSEVLHYTGEESMTLSMWLWMNRKDQQQYILAATDPVRLDRKHFGLYTEGKKLVFIHRQENEATNKDTCQSVFVWKPEIFDKHWHHVLITVEGCEMAKLYVDAEEVKLSNVKENWPLHGTNMAKRIVVGARWLGREQKYVDFFSGYLAGLSVNFEESVNEKSIKCVYECKEHIKIDSPAPSGFTVTQKGHKVVEINGQGSPKTFERILHDLVYINTRRSPTEGRRPLQIKATINQQPLPMLNLQVAVSSGAKNPIELSGGIRKVISLHELERYGIRIAERLSITADKCAKYIDSARIEVDPPLTNFESLVSAGPLLDMLHLKKQVLKGKGLVITGVATLQQYTNVLREIVFVHSDVKQLKDPSTVVHHRFKFTVSNLKNRHVSNIMQTELTTDQSPPQYDMQPLRRPQKGELRGHVQKPFTSSPSTSFWVAIGLIVAASCVFVALIIVVAFNLNRKKNAYVDVPVEEGDETRDEGQCVEENKKMTVTVNPLEKFETEDHAGSRGSKNPKTLEWDDAYIA